MYLDLKGLDSKCQVIDRSTFTSKSTGSELEKLTVEIVVLGSDSNDRLLNIIAKAKEEGIDAIDERGNTGKKWKIVNDSFSYHTATRKWQLTQTTITPYGLKRWRF